MSGSGLVQFKLMLPADLKDRVAEVAQQNRRSLSQEIVATLDEKYPAPVISEDVFQMCVFRDTFSTQGNLAWARRQLTNPDQQAAVSALLENFVLLQKEVVEDGLSSEARRPELLQLLQRGKQAAMHDLSVIRAGEIPEDFWRIRTPTDD